MKEALHRKLGGIVSPLELILFAVFFVMLSILVRWEFAAVLLAGLFVHEMGHVVAMRAYGIRIKGVYFIFPLGAFIPLDGQPPTRLSEAVIGLAGPVAGLLTAFAAMAVYAVTGHPAAMAAAGLYAFFNLFNLLPLRPLDGGRAASALAYSIGDAFGMAFQAGAVVVCGYLGLRYAPVLFLIALFGWAEFRSELRRVHRAEDRRCIVSALARAFGCPASPEAVCGTVDAYQRNVLAFDDERVLDARRRLLRDAADQPLNADTARSELLSVPSRIAAEARKGRIPLFSVRTEYATDLDELLAFPPPLGTEYSPLRTFLTEKERPAMGPFTGLAVLAAYVVLAVLLWGCLVVSANSLGIDEILNTSAR